MRASADRKLLGALEVVHPLAGFAGSTASFIQSCRQAKVSMSERPSHIAVAGFKEAILPTLTTHASLIGVFDPTVYGYRLTAGLENLGWAALDELQAKAHRRLADD